MVGRSVLDSGVVRIESCCGVCCCVWNQGMLTRRSNAPYSEAAMQVAAVREKLAKGRDAIIAENAQVRKKKKQKKAAA